MTPRIDIHNYKHKEAMLLQKLEKTAISDVNKELIKDFVGDLDLGVKLSTARRVKLFSTLKNIALKLDKPFDQATDKDLRQFVAKIQGTEEYTVWTKADYIKIFKRFYAWLNTQKSLNLNISWINGNVKEKDMPRLKRSEMLTEQEVKKLVETAEHARDKAMFSLLWDSGARIGEIGAMTIANVHFEDQGTVVDLVGKTGKRTAFLIECTPHLMNWINLHPFKNDRTSPLWINFGRRATKKFSALDYGSFYHLLGRAFQKAGIKKDFNPHLFRHSRALWCVQNNWNNVMANKMFGWGMSSKMYNYYVALSTEDLQDKMRECYGLPTKKKEAAEERKPRVCPRCESVNEHKAKFCFKCGHILDMQVMKEVMTMKEKEAELQNEVFSRNVEHLNLGTGVDWQNALFEVIKQNPELLNKLRELKKDVVKA